MTTLPSPPARARGRRKPRRRDHIVAAVIPVAAAACAVGLVGYLLWPTWQPVGSGHPAPLPITVGGTLFDVPAAAVRRKVQRYPGDHDRIDLEFSYPALEPPGPPQRVSAESIKAHGVTLDRIFLTIAVHNDTMAPAERVRTIYPQYFDGPPLPARDGLTLQAFRDGTPYEHEDLFLADTSGLVARCSRDRDTPGICLSERRIGGADLTYRFPRRWLSYWRGVANAMDQLTKRLQGPRAQ